MASFITVPYAHVSRKRKGEEPDWQRKTRSHLLTEARKTDNGVICRGRNLNAFLHHRRKENSATTGTNKHLQLGLGFKASLHLKFDLQGRFNFQNKTSLHYARNKDSSEHEAKFLHFVQKQKGKRKGITSSFELKLLAAKRLALLVGRLQGEMFERERKGRRE